MRSSMDLSLGVRHHSDGSVHGNEHTVDRPNYKRSLVSCVLSRFSHVQLFATPWAARLPWPWDFQGKNPGVGYHALLQGIFLTQRLSPHFLRLLGLAGRFFTTSNPWEALSSSTRGKWDCFIIWICIDIIISKNEYIFSTKSFAFVFLYIFLNLFFSFSVT